MYNRLFRRRSRCAEVFEFLFLNVSLLPDNIILSPMKLVQEGIEWAQSMQVCYMRGIPRLNLNLFPRFFPLL